MEHDNRTNEPANSRWELSSDPGPVSSEPAQPDDEKPIPDMAGQCFMFCPRCGLPGEAAAEFCGRCGARRCASCSA